MSLDPQLADRQQRVSAELAALGFVLPGTLLERRLTCRSPGCHCHGDPPSLHGPYWYWTRKINAKTVSQVLSPEQVNDYQPWFTNARRLRELVHQLEEVSVAVVDADPRTPRRRR